MLISNCVLSVYFQLAYSPQLDVFLSRLLMDYLWAHNLASVLKQGDYIYREAEKTEVTVKGREGPGVQAF